MTLFICLILSSIFSCAHELENEVHISLPEHSECFDDPLTMETCQAIVDEDPRQPTTSMNRSGVEPIDNDPRLEDPDYIWLKEQIEHCTCVCCHRSSLGGPGAYFWDIEHKPMWIDSANSWSTLFWGDGWI